MKILTILGARPQFIKAATVSRVLQAQEDVREVLVHTGQHFDENMSDIFFDELEIPKPKYHLGIGGGNHGQQTGRMLEAIENVLLEEQPDWVLVYGDTNSTLAGALSSVKLHVPVAHVEAGLRSFNRKMPEEINRIMTDHIAEILFAPTDIASRHLKNEGIPSHKIQLVGDVMYDASLFYGNKAEKKSTILQTRDLKAGKYILSTVHRSENTDDPEKLKDIFDALSVISNDLPVVLPLHPRTRKALNGRGMLNSVESNITVVPPLGYLDMAMLEKYAKVVVTDSGGVQKEAFFYSVPCVTLRDETEWVELVDLGWNTLAPPETVESVVTKIRKVLSRPPGKTAAPYGKGDSAERIVQILKSF